MKKNNTGFSIIEVMIGIFVFALGLTSVFMMLSGSITMSDYSRNLIIASHLANEQLELFKNVRDSNYKQTSNWLNRDPNKGDKGIFEAGKRYLLENNYGEYNHGDIDFSINTQELDSYEEGKDKIVEMLPYRLCYDTENRYVYCKTRDLEKTPFFRYLYIEEAGSFSENSALKITSKVIWIHRGYHSTEISTVVTDWKKY